MITEQNKFCFKRKHSTSYHRW